jgi:hypothetical protein
MRLVVTVNPDPSISGSFTLTNLSLSTQTFVLNVTLPVPGGIAAPTVMGGFVGSATNGVEYFDQNDDGDVTFESVGTTPIYQARLDNTLPGAVTVQGLLLGTFQAFGDPRSVREHLAAPMGHPDSQRARSRVQRQHEHPHHVLADSGRSRSIPVNFVIEPAPVPEPGSLALIGLSVARARAAQSPKPEADFRR